MRSDPSATTGRTCVPALRIVSNQQCENFFAEPALLKEKLAWPVTTACWASLHQSSFCRHIIPTGGDPTGDAPWWMSVSSEPLENSARALLFVAPSLPCFDGHFPEAPLLPGVLQLSWAVELADTLWGADTAAADFTGIARLKFSKPILPGAVVALRLTLSCPTSKSKEPRSVAFRIESKDGLLTSARLLYGG